ncbi:phytosulfokines-like [Gastrolobium bilobum]|uniref:phytosulfokines-like n=1 Tax=Gastrolobium bilobum TaxID=150636 RepID=UPI002AB2EE7C|nr:phytosulfokines-like [Gastrolobium bilobum]
MSKITALFFTVLFLCYMVTHSARPEPVFHKESSAVTHHQEVEAVDESCEGIREEECLMRRTLVAHIDYIYTQKHNP